MDSVFFRGIRGFCYWYIIDIYIIKLLILEMIFEINFVCFFFIIEEFDVCGDEVIYLMVCS